MTPKPMKPILAWAIVTKSGRLVWDVYGEPLVGRKEKELAELMETCEDRIARVSIREVQPKPKARRV